MTETIRRVTLRRLRMPLHVPYKLSYRTFEEFEPYLVEIVTTEGRHGFGDGHISPGSSDETREGGWAFSREMASWFAGRTLADAMAHLRSNAARSKVAATAFATAIEATGQSELLAVDEAVRLPLLSPLAGAEPDAIRRELDDVHARGFRTVKIKVGQDLEADLVRVATIQEAGDGRSTIRNAGEFNGFLKSSVSLFDEPLRFEDGAITMPAGYRPSLDPDRVAAHTTAREVFDA